MADTPQPVLPSDQPVAPIAPAAPEPETPESLTEKFKAGQFGLPKGKPVAVQLADGSHGTVPAHEAQSVVDAGGLLLDPETHRRLKWEARYGGIGGALAATGEGVARGLTVGLSDPLAVGAARAFGGNEAAEATREHLADVREAHPYISTGAELVGAAAPIVASGGAAAPEEAAMLAARGVGEAASVARMGASVVDTGEALAASAKAATSLAGAADTAKAVDAASTAVASAAGPVRAAIRGAGALNRGIAEAGELASSRVGALIGEGSGGGLANLGKRVAAKAAQGVVEGGLYGAGNEVSEATLGNHDLNAEKLLSAVGHGALIGGAFTGSLETLGSLSRSVIGRVAPQLEAQANMHAWKSLSPLKKFTEQAEARMPGGAKGVGEVMIRRGVIPDSLAGATPEQLLPRIETELGVVRNELTQAMDETGARVPVSRITNAVEDVIAPLRRKAGFEPIVKTLETYQQSLIEKLAPAVERDGAPVTKMVERQLTDDELRTMNAVNWTPADAIANNVTFKGNKAFIKEPVVVGVEKELQRPLEVRVQALFEQRKALDDLVYRESKSLDPQMRVAFMREIRGKLANMEIESIDEAAKLLGQHNAGKVLKGLRTDYQALSIAEDAAETSTSRMATNRNLSISDYGSAMMAAASGHIMAAPVAAIAHKLIRERGNSVAAYTLSKLAALASVERAAASVDRQIDRGISGFLRAGTKAELKPKPRSFKNAEEAMNAVAKAAVNDGAHVAAIDRSVADIEEHVPLTAAAYKRAALATTAYLAGKVPANARQFSSPTPHIETPRISDAQKASFMRSVEAAHDPVGVVLSNMKSNTLMPEHVDALRELSPNLYQEIVYKLHEEMASRKVPVAYEKKKQMSILFGTPMDPTFERPFVTAMQKNFVQQAAANDNGRAQVPSAPKRSLGPSFSRDTKLPGL